MEARPPLRVAIVGHPSSIRVSSFNAALGRSGQPPATVVSYLDLIEGRASTDRALPEGGLVRIESPGQDFSVEQALLALGADVEDEDGEGPRADFPSRGGPPDLRPGAGLVPPAMVPGLPRGPPAHRSAVVDPPRARRPESPRGRRGDVRQAPMPCSPGVDGRPLSRVARAGPVLRGTATKDERGEGRPGVCQAGSWVVGLGRGGPGGGRPGGRGDDHGGGRPRRRRGPDLQLAGDPPGRGRARGSRTG